MTSTSAAQASHGSVGRMLYFVPAGKLHLMMVVCAIGGFVLSPFYADDSAWVGVGVAAIAFVTWHAGIASRRIPWVPALVALVAGIQWVLAPWAAYHVPAGRGAIPMQVSAEEYFAFAVPVFLALVLGLFLPLHGQGKTVPQRNFGAINPRTLGRTCDAFLAIGVFAYLILPAFLPASLQFAGALLGELGYVGAFAGMLVRRQGWRWRVLIPLTVEAIVDSFWGQYFSLVLWSLYFAALYVYVWRVSRIRIVAFITIGMLAVLTLNGVKGAFREEVLESDLTTLQRAGIAAQSFGDMASDPARLFSQENVSFNVSRLNQGGVISRVLYWVPNFEPFANGETISTAIVASLVPRAFNPNKVLAGGFENYPRFTGFTLRPGTSINLSWPGELYANFGIVGAIVGTGICGFLIGLLFRMFVRWSRQSVLWWAWVPFALFSTISAESGLVETLNQVVKSLVVMVAIIFLVPGWATLRRQLRVRRRRDPSVSRPARPAVEH